MNKTSSPHPLGRRERRKAETRRSLAAAAERLFLAHGYDAVTVAEIAEAADVAVSTLFAYFPAKESLLFSRDAEVGAGFVAAVTERDLDTPILQALRAYVHAAPDLANGSLEFVALVRGTPALTRYIDRMWTRHAEDLAVAIATATGVDPADTVTRAVARYVVEVPSIVRADLDRAAAINATFDLLAGGWREPLPRR